jgi:hypothetical protein
VAQSGGRITTHTQTYSEFGLAQSKLWPAGTVCITIAANIADTAILKYPACFPDSVVGFVADPEKSLPEFIKWSIDVISDRLEAFAPATAQKNINLAVLNDVEFRCPPINEQHEIVRRIEALFAYADRLEARYTTACAQVERLTPALLAKAFRGELVPQDPNDEPASVLLERIRASRAAAGEKPLRKARTERKPIATKLTTDALKDILRDAAGVRRRSFDPYADRHLKVVLDSSVPFGGADGQTPDWQIDFAPDSVECTTWDNVFHVRERIKRDVLDASFW